MEGRLGSFLKIIVEYWRRRYQRMNTESFVAANVMALITHTVVSINRPRRLFHSLFGSSKRLMIVDPAP